MSEKGDQKREYLSSIFYDPSIGLTSSPQKLFSKIPLEQIKLLNITLSDVSDFIKSQEVNQVYKRRPVKHYYALSSSHPFERVQIDLLDVSLDSRFNSGVKYLLCCIDVYTKIAFVYPLKNKGEEEVLKGFKECMEEIYLLSYSYPTVVDSDKESSFLSKRFSDYCKEKNITLRPIEGDEQAYQVERFNRTMREMIEKYQTSFNTRRYIDDLQNLVGNYNNSYHSRLEKTPLEAMVDNKEYEDNVRKQNMKATVRSIRGDFDGYKVGERVRVMLKKNIFDKGTSAKWSKSIHTIERIVGNSSIFVSDRVSPYRAYELLRIDKVEKYNEGGEEENIDEQLREVRTERRVNRRMNTEGVERNTSETRERRNRRARDLGPVISY